MNKELIATVSTTIKAPTSTVWSAITDPEKIKLYLYGTQTETDWQVGSPIRFTGEWEGTPYVDKGEITTFEPESKLQYTYLSSFTGLADKPENYSLVTFELVPNGTTTALTISQTNFKDEAHRNHSKTNWEHVLGQLKAVVEG